MKKQFTFPLVTVLCLSLAACASPVKVKDAQLVAEPDPISLRLAEAADRAATALETLASVEQARTPDIGISTVPDAPQELRRTVTLDWVGPVEPLAQRLAERAGYAFAVIGDRPPVQVVVTIKAVERSVVDVLRDIGLQAGRRADLIVDAERRVVEVNYAPISGG